MLDNVQDPHIPGHVPAQLVVDFDIYDLPQMNDADPQTAYVAFRDKGDIFWTPRNGGHWVLTRAEDIRTVQNDWNNFTRAPGMSLPPIPGQHRTLPFQSDPPEHIFFRRPIMGALMPQVVEKLAPKVRETAGRLIDPLVAKGECEFVSAFAQKFPIMIFLDLVDLPQTDREILLPLAEVQARSGDQEKRGETFKQIAEYLAPVVRARREHPGEDLFSLVSNVVIDGEKVSYEDALACCSAMLVAGLDTVAAMLSFITRHLALHPDHRRMLVEKLQSGEDDFIRNAVEEMLRRYGIANSIRNAAHDMEFKGVKFAKGDRILCANVYYGLDDRLVARPMEVDFNRDATRLHAAFDLGPHTCAGTHLARRELRIFLEEWLKRIPDFSIKPGTKPQFSTGMVSGVVSLELVWPKTA